MGTLKVAFVSCVCLLLTISAWSLALASTAEGSAVDDCAEKWSPLIVQAGLPTTQALSVLGCRQALNGEWVDVTIGDLRMFEPVVDLEFANDVDVVQARKALLQDIKSMLAAQTLSNLGWGYDIDTYELSISNSDGTIDKVSLKGDYLMIATSRGFGMYRQNIDNALTAYLLDPNHVRLLNYAIWFSNQRDSTLLSMSVGHGGESAMFLRSFDYKMVPWPWQLADHASINGYLLWLDVSQ